MLMTSGKKIEANSVTHHVIYQFEDGLYLFVSLFFFQMDVFIIFFQAQIPNGTLTSNKM